MSIQEPQLQASGKQFDAALQRAMAEFREMPGLRLTAEQARRLWALDDTACRAVLAALLEARFLTQMRDASFIRTA
jgi:hypothetical protein